MTTKSLQTIFLYIAEIIDNISGNNSNNNSGNSYTTGSITARNLQPGMLYETSLHDDDDDAVYDNNGGEVIGLITGFFFIWNIMIASKTVPALLGIFRCEPKMEDIIFLICPHWLVGIIVPIAIIYSTSDTVSVILFSIISIIIPYSIHLYLACRNVAPATTDAESTTTPTTTRTHPRPSAPLSTSDSAQQSNTPSVNNVERLLITKKVVAYTTKAYDEDNEDSSDEITASSSAIEYDIEKGCTKSYRANHPKEDIVLFENAGVEVTESIFTQMMNSIRNFSLRSQVDQQQQQQCSICLETYKVGDIIAYSYHPSCHHAFHKTCIVQWLRSNRRTNECPICRYTFIPDPSK